MLKSKLLLTLTLFTFLALPFAGIARSPSTDLMEVELIDRAPATDASGFNFENKEESFKRTPANIVSNHKRGPASQVYVPFLILMAIPFGIWLLVSKQKKIAIELEAAFKEEDKIKSIKKDDDDFSMPKAS